MPASALNWSQTVVIWLLVFLVDVLVLAIQTHGGYNQCDEEQGNIATLIKYKCLFVFNGADFHRLSGRTVFYFCALQRSCDQKYQQKVT